MKIFFVAVFFIFNLSVFAEEIVISTFVTGEAYHVQNGKKNKLKVNTQIRENDSVFTKKGKVDLQIGKNTAVRLVDNTDFSLKEFFENEKVSKTKIGTTQGNVFSKIIKPLNKDSSYSVESPTHVAGVRGTEFVFSSNDSDVGEGVYVNQGSVELEDKSSGQTETADSNEQIVLTAKEMQKGLLADYMKEKMKIFKTLSVMKEENYKILKEQILKNQTLLEEAKNPK